MRGSDRSVLVSKEVLNQAQVVSDFLEGHLSRKAGACAIGKSERTFSRKVKEFLSNGTLGLEHGLRNKPPVNRICEGIREQIKGLLRGKYAGFNLKHFHEYLEGTEKVTGVSYSTVRRLAHELGIQRTKSRRVNVRKKRKRHAQTGYLLQMDGSPHKWFGGVETCLVSGIDDASSDVAYGEFFETETLESYLRVLRKIIEKRGVPLAIYVDKASWLGGNSTPEHSQFLRVCEELGIRVIYAHSPEAKGRVERLWKTLQDRLISEMRLNEVTTIEAANQYFNETFLLETWAKRFTVIPQSARSAYRPRPRQEDLDQIFCLKFERKVKKDHTLQFGNQVYGITANLGYSVARKHIELRVYLDGSMRGFYGGKDLELRQERSGAWDRYAVAKVQPGLTTWLKLLGTEPLVNTAS